MKALAALLALSTLASVLPAPSQAAEGSAAAPPASSSAPTARDLDRGSTAARPPLALPTPEEWLKKTGRSTIRIIETSPDELPLFVYREPAFQVIGIDPNTLCPEPRQEPTFEILFGAEGKVEAFQAMEPNPCPKLVDAWTESISAWRWIQRGPNDPEVPALIRVRFHLVSKAKSGAPKK